MTSPDNDAGRSESSDSTAGGSEPSPSGHEAPPIEQTEAGSADPQQTVSPPTQGQPQDYPPPPAYIPPPAYTTPPPSYEPPGYPPTAGYPPSGGISSPAYPPPPGGYPPPYSDPGQMPPYPTPGYGGPGYPPPGPYGSVPGNYPPPAGPYPGADYGYGYGGYPSPAAGQTNSLAVAALVSSLVALPAYLMCFIGFFPSILAIILGAIGLSQVKRSGEKGKEMAIAGIAIGAAALVLAFLLLVLIGASDTTTF